jgi:DNA-binding LacI/PurR family transcriptional regulator
MITIKDVAREAGVSTATVSLALSDHPRIAETTKLKIQSAAAALGYVPVRNTQKKATARPRCCIGVLFLSAALDENPITSEAFMGICQDAQRSGYNVMLLGAQVSPDDASDLSPIVDQAGVDGIIVFSYSPELRGLHKLIERKFPLVIIGKRYVHGLSGTEARFVATDSYGGGRMAAEYLWSLGHSRFLVAASRNFMPWEKERFTGFKSFLEEQEPGTYFIDDQPFLSPQQYDYADPVWEQVRDAAPHAVFSTMPQPCMQLMKFFQDERIAIPDEVSLLCFDDTPTAALETPPLSVIKQDMKSVGRMAAQSLLDALANPDASPMQLRISCQLIKRASCAPHGSLQREASNSSK